MRNELKYAKILEENGLSRDQAERHLRVIEGAMLDNVATKQDIERLDFKIDGVRSELKADMAEFRSEMNIKIANLEVEVVKVVNKLGIMIVVASTTITAVLSGVAALFKFAF